MNETNSRESTLGSTEGSDQARDKVNIFISHKSEDRKTAEKIIDILKKYDNPIDPKISFFLSYEIPGGDRWYFGPHATAIINRVVASCRHR